MTGEWKVGDLGYYMLPPAPRCGRPTALYLAIVVTNVTPDRIVVRRRDGRGGHRNVKGASGLVREAPMGAWRNGV